MNRNKIVERIRALMKKSELKCDTILYGSEARGEATETSDIDLLILVDGDSLSIDDEIKITAPLYDIEYETGVMISPLVMLRKVWEGRSFLTPFAMNVKRDGILL